MKRNEFEKLVEEAVGIIPDEFRNHLDNITIIVEDRPSQEVYALTQTPRGSLILGLYHGVPYKHRGPYYGNVPPDVISIYQQPIEALCSTHEEIRVKIKEVIIHEIGHYFGFNDSQLHAIEREHHKKKK